MSATMECIVVESTGQAVVEYLRTAGHDVLAVAEAMPQADDGDILARAESEARILITNDKDFGALVFRSGQAHQGVVLRRTVKASCYTYATYREWQPPLYADALHEAFEATTDNPGLGHRQPDLM